MYQPDLDQECVVAGVRAAPVSESGLSVALQVANALLGGMKSGRLFTQLREKQGLAYDLGSLYDPAPGRRRSGRLCLRSAPTRT